MNIFLFHRDLRIFDNTSLRKLFEHILKSKKSKFTRVTPIFIFPPEQIDPDQNKYFSNNSVQFMINSLRELNIAFEEHNGKKDKNDSGVPSMMYYFKGKNLEVLKDIHNRIGINSLAYNLDYTPFAKKRDK